jgi:hypothetical protein
LHPASGVKAGTATGDRNHGEILQMSSLSLRSTFLDFSLCIGKHGSNYGSSSDYRTLLFVLGYDERELELTFRTEF